jgi:hypothetical protein
LLVFTATALAWTVVYLAFELRAKAREFTYFPWLLVNVVQIEVLWIAKVLWPPSSPSSPPSPTISVLCFEFPWLWILSGASILLLYADLWFQLGFHWRSPASSRAAIR